MGVKMKLEVKFEYFSTPRFWKKKKDDKIRAHVCICLGTTAPEGYFLKSVCEWEGGGERYVSVCYHLNDPAAANRQGALVFFSFFF